MTEPTPSPSRKAGVGSEQERGYMDKDAATVLEDAADLLLIHGRCTHALRNNQGEHCALGAIYEAAGCLRDDGVNHNSATWDATTALIRHLEHGDIAHWNNHLADDFEVIDTLRHVAKNLRNQAAAT